MTNVVFDTNAVVSTVLTPHGVTSKAFKLMLTQREFQLYYSEEILREYKRVLAYPRLNIAALEQVKMLTLIEKVGVLIAPSASTVHFVDESDRIFYDTARAANAVLVTGNLKHFPNEDFIMNPADFLVKYGGEVK